MTELHLLDVVGMRAKDLHQALFIILLLPFIFAFGVVVSFRLLDRFSSKDSEAK